MRMNTDKIAAA